jgi:hypothetical protein
VVGVVEVRVGAEEEVFEGGGGVGTTRLISFPSDGDGRFDADEDEEGPPEELVQDQLVVDVGCYPAGAPALGDEVEEGVGVVEGV